MNSATEERPMPKRSTVTLTDDLAEAAEILRLRRRYRSFSEYVNGLIRYDGQSQKEHHLTADWAALDGYERDRLDAAILEQVKSGKGVLGSWLEAKIHEIVKRHIEAGTVPTKKQVASELAHKISDF